MYRSVADVHTACCCIHSMFSCWFSWPLGENWCSLQGVAVQVIVGVLCTGRAQACPGHTVCVVAAVAAQELQIGAHVNISVCFHGVMVVHGALQEVGVRSPDPTELLCKWGLARELLAMRGEGGAWHIANP